MQAQKATADLHTVQLPVPQDFFQLKIVIFTSCDCLAMPVMLRGHLMLHNQELCHTLTSSCTTSCTRNGVPFGKMFPLIPRLRIGSDRPIWGPSRYECFVVCALAPEP